MTPNSRKNVKIAHTVSAHSHDLPLNQLCRYAVFSNSASSNSATKGRKSPPKIRKLQLWVKSQIFYTIGPKTYLVLAPLSSHSHQRLRHRLQRWFPTTNQFEMHDQLLIHLQISLTNLQLGYFSAKYSLYLYLLTWNLIADRQIRLLSLRGIGLYSNHRNLTE